MRPRIRLSAGPPRSQDDKVIDYSAVYETAHRISLGQERRTVQRQTEVDQLSGPGTETETGLIYRAESVPLE